MYLLEPAITSSREDAEGRDQVGPVVDAVLRFGLAQDLRQREGARELFESAFTDDAVLDFRPAAKACGLDVPLMVGRAMITDIIMNPATLIDTTHVVTNARVQVTEDAARLTALVEAQHLPRGDHSRHALLKNYYDVDAVLVDGLWRMSRVEIENVWFTGDPQVIGGN